MKRTLICEKEKYTPYNIYDNETIAENKTTEQRATK